MHFDLNNSNNTDIKPYSPTDEELFCILSTNTYDDFLTKKACTVRQKAFDDTVYIRGLIEFTNHCKNDCYYCGIRRGNVNLKRYRLDTADILNCCKNGYDLGFRTFVLQGGEDPLYTDKKICTLVAAIREKFPDCAITLSIGEKSRQSYKDFFDAGADRYLLRHETADNNHYLKLHPKSMSLKNRKRCLYDLKDIGFQVGSGFMVGSPFQTTENLVQDIKFLKKLSPHMIGIGPYINHKDTPFKEYKSGSLPLTLKLISLLRLMFPYGLIPATTALSALDKDGQQKGLISGANVIMPNLTPSYAREKYCLYENKNANNDEVAMHLSHIKAKVQKTGYRIVTDRGNSPLLNTDVPTYRHTDKQIQKTLNNGMITY